MSCKRRQECKQTYHKVSKDGFSLHLSNAGEQRQNANNHLHFDDNVVSSFESEMRVVERLVLRRNGIPSTIYNQGLTISPELEIANYQMGPKFSENIRQPHSSYFNESIKKGHATIVDEALPYGPRGKFSW